MKNFLTLVQKLVSPLFGFLLRRDEKLVANGAHWFESDSKITAPSGYKIVPCDAYHCLRKLLGRKWLAKLIFDRRR